MHEPSRRLSPSESSEWTARGTLEGCDSAHLLSILDAKIRSSPRASLRAQLKDAVQEVVGRRRRRGDHEGVQKLSKLLPNSRPDNLGGGSCANDAGEDGGDIYGESRCGEGEGGGKERGARGAGGEGVGAAKRLDGEDRQEHTPSTPRSGAGCRPGVVLATFQSARCCLRPE